MWALLSRWLESTNHRSNLVARSIATLFPSLLPHVLTQVMPRVKDHPLFLHEKGWIIGDQLTNQEGVIPVITFRASGTPSKVEDAAFNVALMSLVNENLVAEGWRFEQAEAVSDGDEVAAHPFAHAQAIIGWERGVNCLIHPPHGDGENCDGLNKSVDEKTKEERARSQLSTLDQHPAFPLGVKSLSGLAMAVFVTLYGVPRAREVFGSVRKVTAAEGEIREDFSRLCLL